jgi:hypothetical protein
MARLIVVAESEDTIAAPGNRNPNYICVSVTDSHGVPVTGLDQSNFGVGAMIVGPGGADIEVADVYEYGTDSGFYYIDVIPTRDYPWVYGVYIFAITVKHGNDRGQTLTSVLLD